MGVDGGGSALARTCAGATTVDRSSSSEDRFDERPSDAGSGDVGGLGEEPCAGLSLRLKTLPKRRRAPPPLARSGWGSGEVGTGGGEDSCSVSELRERCEEVEGWLFC